MENIKDFINRQKWTFAKTMAETPHKYVVRESLSEDDQKLFDEFEGLIKKEGYVEEFFSKEYTYYRIGDYKYWVVDNVLNRAEVK